MTQHITPPAPPSDKPSSPHPHSPILQPSDPPKFPSNPNSALSPGPPAFPSTTPNMRVHPSVLRYALPLSKFCRLPLNAGKEIWVGLIIVGKDVEEATALLVRPLPTHTPAPDSSTSFSTIADFSSSSPGLDTPQACSPPSPPASDQDPHFHSPSTVLPSFEEGWDLPSLRAKLGVDQTLLEAVDRCAKVMTGRGVREISRFLQSSDLPIGPLSNGALGPGNGGLREVSGDLNGKTNRAGRAIAGCQGESGMVRRYDFLVKLHPGPTMLPRRWEGKWVDTDESWRVMKRIPRGAALT